MSTDMKVRERSAHQTNSVTDMEREKSKALLPSDLVRDLLRQKYQYLSRVDAELQEKESLIVRKDAELMHMDSLIRMKDAELQQKEGELHFMRTSKFWKIRNLYFKLGLQKVHPKRISGTVKAALSKRSTVVTEALLPAESITSFDKDIELGTYSPKVTIIVPSYNHAKFLKQRLDSIYAQTYENFEVILLDDRSSDNSQAVLKKYATKYKDKTRFVFNEKNSGNVFAQWRRGIKMAKGDLVWIAESDDYCDPNFLEELTKYFKDESVMLAYAYSEFVDENGTKSDFSFDSYVSRFSTTKWAKSYVETAHNEVRAALGIKNTIPNVSGVVFRNFPYDQFDYDSLRQFRVCGDWYFYLSIIRGGKLAFVRETKNYYRFHTNNTSSNYQKNIGFVKEHETVAKLVARDYAVTVETLKGNMQAVKEVWDAQNPGNEKAFAQAYNLVEVKKELKNRKPNILMAIYAFTTGGGEVVPIRLANELKAQDYAVTLFDFSMAAPKDHTIKNMLNGGIPITKYNAATFDIDVMLKDFGIEIIHSHHVAVDLLFAKRANKKISHIVTTHGVYETISKIDMAVIEPDLRNVTYWVYVADKNLDPLDEFSWFSKRPKMKISNGYTPPQTKHAVSRALLHISNDAFVLCLVSRAITHKGWREAIDAVKIANWASERQIVLVLIGDGPMFDELKQLGDENMRFLGFKQNVSDYYALADIGILPTTFPGESCPIVLIECVSAGKPFISTDIGEIKSMLTTKDGSVAGKVLELHEGIVDVYELADSIVRFANDKEYYQKSKDTAGSISKRFSMEYTIEQYEKVYEQCVTIRQTKTV